MSWLKVQRVVVPIDPSDADETGVRVALDAVSPENVHVVIALPDRFTADPSEQVAEARVRLRAWLGEQAYPNVIRTHVAHGRPADVILDLALTVDADLIAIPSHGRRGMPRLLLGSVAEEVVRRASCAVLVLRKVVVSV